MSNLPKWLGILILVSFFLQNKKEKVQNANCVLKFVSAIVLNQKETCDAEFQLTFFYFIFHFLLPRVPMFVSSICVRNQIH